MSDRKFNSSDRHAEEAESLLDSYGVNNSDAGEEKLSFFKRPWPRSRVLYWAFVLFVLLYLVFLVVVFRGQISHVFKVLQDFLGPDGPLKTWLKGHAWAPFAYGGIYILCTVAFLPASALTILAGVIFKLGVALAVVSVSSTIGATCAMLLGRTVLRSWVLRKVSAFKSFLAIERAISKTSWLVFLLRLSPVIPFNLLNYALGLTEVPTLHYVLYSWVGMMPGTFLFVYIGWATQGAVQNADKKSKLAENILTYGVGSVVSIIAVVVITIIARRQLQKQMALAEQEVEADIEDTSVAAPQKAVEHF